MPQIWDQDSPLALTRAYALVSLVAIIATVGLSAVMVVVGLRLLVRAGASGGPSPELLVRSGRR